MRFFPWLLLLLFLTSCAASVSTEVLRSVDPLPQDESVQVDMNAIDPPEDSGSVLGSVRVKDSGFSLKCGYEYGLDRIREEARMMGGNYVIIREHKLPSMASSCHQFRADVYRLDELPPLAQEPLNIQVTDSLAEDSYFESERSFSREPSTSEKERNLSPFRLAIGAGFSYRLNGLPEGLSPDLEDYARGLKSGWHRMAEAQWFIDDQNGIGLHYSSFLSSGSATFLARDEMGDELIVEASDDIEIQFYALSWASRSQQSETGTAFYLSAALGYMRYINDSVFLVSERYEGESLGFGLQGIAEFPLSGAVNLGVQLSLFSGAIGSFEITDEDGNTRTFDLPEEQTEGLFRLDGGLTLSWTP